MQYVLVFGGRDIFVLLVLLLLVCCVMLSYASYPMAERDRTFGNARIQIGT